MTAALLAAATTFHGGVPLQAAPVVQTDDENESATVLAAAQSGDWNPRRQQVQSAQTWLRQLGYNPGTTAGAVSEEMRLALRLYQRDNDLSENGRLTRKTFEHLRAKAGNAPPAKPVAAAPAAATPAAAAPARAAAAPATKTPEQTAAATPAPAIAEPVLEPSAPPPAQATDSTALLVPTPGDTPAFQLSDPVAPSTTPTTAPTTEAAAPAEQQLAEVRTGHVSSEAAATADLTPTIDPTNDESGSTQTAMIVPRPQLCGSPVGGSWMVKDENGSEFIVTLRGDGTVIGPLYPEYWTWRPTDLGVEIGYSNEMGQRVVRHGALRGSAAIAGEATDSRGRTWSWSAVRAIDAATTPDTSCAKVGPA